MDYDLYPDHVLDAATPVYVVIENGSGSDLSISREDFALVVPGGMQETPLVPEQIYARNTDPQASRQPSEAFRPVRLSPALGWQSAQSQRPEVELAAVTVPAPPPHLGTTVPVAPLYPHGPWGYSGGPYYDAGPYYDGDPFFWDAPWYWGSGGYWGGPVYSPRPRKSIIRPALQDGTLPKGGRTFGFLYFPLISNGKSGTPVLLHWELHDAAHHNVLGHLELHLELDDEP
jgi:hypothetical protein